MRTNTKYKLKAGIVVILFLLSSFLISGLSSVAMDISNNENIAEDIIIFPEDMDDRIDKDQELPEILDTIFIPKEDVAFAGEQNDVGSNIDAGDVIQRSLPLFLGETVDERVPGRGRTGLLDPENGDDADCYKFLVCNGQQISVSVNNFEVQIYAKSDPTTPQGQTYTAVDTDYHFFEIKGDTYGSYTISASISGQNDAGTGGDAGDDINSAILITPGVYDGYMDATDWEDWYSFDVELNQGIFVNIDTISNEAADYDIHLYNPSGELVHSAVFYGPDELEYPADMPGNWKIKIDMFPGWDTAKWPDNYFLYGYGPYTLDLSFGDSAEYPIEPQSQPDIIPVAQTFIVNDDPNSNKDEYGYMAAVPAANYIEGDKRYVSPIVYQGLEEITHWYGTIDDTTQYLIDDWNTYLARHGKEADEYTILDDPIKAAADIATKKWSSSKTAVITVDGSGFEDDISEVINVDASLDSPPEISTYKPEELEDFDGIPSVPMFIGSKYGAIHLVAKGDEFTGDTGIITPRYERLMDDWWPYPYPTAAYPGPDMDTFYPIIKPGFWIPLVSSTSGLEELQIIKYRGDRYKIPVSSTDSSIEITVTTDDPSNLIVYLIDPEGNIRRPSIPHWNGGEINPIHYWNGGHWEHDEEEFRFMRVDPHLDYSISVHNAMKGTWTAIVVPYMDSEEWDIGFSDNYHITANIRKYSSDRISAGLSAANGAVIASSIHAPLLYVTKDSVPTDTSDALTQLGVEDIIFVNINKVSSAILPGSVNEYSTLKEVVNAIKSNPKSENFITITSFGTGDGYFAPSAMVASYHLSPILDIGEAPVAYNMLDMAKTWTEYKGDYYHGCRSLGHIPHMDESINLTYPPSYLSLILYYLKNNELPPTGLDLRLHWYGGIHDEIHNLIKNYNLDLDGKEAYLFVSPRDTDIRDLTTRIFTGNNSYAGHIMFETPALSSVHICRDILYPAVIYANEGRDVISSCFMNYRDGHDWTCNDGNRYQDFITQILKEMGFSHGRFFEGHSLWEPLLKRYNDGAGLIYHCSHGTGGSGICCMYENIQEQFPLAEPNNENYKDFTWWDGWRGYYYDNNRIQTPRDSGLTWLNSVEPNLYDIVHFKHCDQLFDNLHSEFNFWMSCTTGSHFGPNIYLEHGCALWFGNGNTGRSPQEEVLDQWVFEDIMDKGLGVGEALSNYLWLHQRDYTTRDPTTIYGRSSVLDNEYLANDQMIFGDPNLQIYSPEWIEPIPIDG
jgi:hypothetical protein